MATPEKIAELRELLAKATPGWVVALCELFPFRKQLRGGGR